MENRILARYSNMFPEEDVRKNQVISPLAFGFECDDGWENLLDRLFAEIDIYLKMNPSAKITVGQIKSKFGGLRFYYHGGDDGVGKIVDKYEKESMHTCETCGSIDARQVGQGWVYTLCENCWDKVKKEKNI